MYEGGKFSGFTGKKLVPTPLYFQIYFWNFWNLWNRKFDKFGAVIYVKSATNKQFFEDSVLLDVNNST